MGHAHHDGATYRVGRRSHDAKTHGIFEATCGHCGGHSYVGGPKDIRMPPEWVRKLFAKQGWLVHHRREKLNRCADCVSSLPAPDPKEGIMSSVATLAPRQMTGSEIRKVTGLLDEHFDDTAGRYASGWDDEKIATQANVPRLSVARLREEGWSKLKSFPDIEDLKSELASMVKMLKELELRVLVAEKKRVAA